MEQKFENLPIRKVYRMFKDGELVVPSYQRPFMWDEAQQQALIQSLLDDLFVGTFIIAARRGGGVYEIVDGHQRVKTICNYIDAGFALGQSGKVLPPKEQEAFLDKSLFFVIIEGIENTAEFAEMFSAINSKGERLSRQQIRQIQSAGNFASFVARLARKIKPGYFWRGLGLFTKKDLYRNEDQVLVARLALAILTGEMAGRDEARLDSLYDPNSLQGRAVEEALANFPAEALAENMQRAFALFAAMPAHGEGEAAFTPESFYILYLAVYNLAVEKGMERADEAAFAAAVYAVQGLVPKAPEEPTYKDWKDFALWKLNDCFTGGQISKEEAEFESFMRGAVVETARNEFKQGLLHLSHGREYNKALEEQILETLCGMANLASAGPCYLLIGVADTKRDAERARQMDGVAPAEVAGHYVVGVKREAELMGTTVEKYSKKIQEFIDRAPLSPHLRGSVLGSMEVFTYKGLEIVRLVVLPQSQPSLYKKELYTRKHSSTVKVTDPEEIIEIARRFFQPPGSPGGIAE